MRRSAFVCTLVLALAAGAAYASGPSGTVQVRVVVNPLSVAVLVPPGSVKAGKDFRIRAEVTNAGSSTVQNVSVRLLAPQALVLRDPATQVLPRVGPGVDRRVRWDACSTTAGGYVVMARATAGALTAESTGQLVQITPANRPRC